MDNVI